MWRPQPASTMQPFALLYPSVGQGREQEEQSMETHRLNKNSSTGKEEKKKKSTRPKGLSTSSKQNDAQQQLLQKATPHVPYPTCCSTPPVSIAKHNTARHGTHCWSIWVSCPGCIPSYQPLAHPSQLTVGYKRETEAWCFASIVQQ